MSVGNGVVEAFNTDCPTSDGGGRMGLKKGELHPIIVMSLATKTGPHIYIYVCTYIYIYIL